ncbi:MAG: HD domain-containing protein [Bacillota bacterium]|nr:HD domain-containing protein [Bacillota bacterium]MDP4158351.1 HD domain-containing protein [Bacillota bacterium]
MFYRLHQFLNAVFPKIDSWDIKWALNHLSPEASELFLKQSWVEQRHAIDVTKKIVNAKNLLSHPDLETLITAALLHDCGKSLVSIRLWHRVYIVLMQKMPLSIWSCLEQSNTVFASPLKIATYHAQWGERLAKKAGLNAQVCLLIREHHSPKTDLGHILAQADNMS